MSLQNVFTTGILTRQDAVHMMAGIFILVSLALYYWVSEWFLIVPAFVGANLFQYGLSGFCPAATIFGMLGLPDAKDLHDQINSDKSPNSVPKKTIIPSEENKTSLEVV
eukprot:gene8642-9352_t